MNKTFSDDKRFDIVNYTLVGIITLIILYPLIYVISASISDPVAVNTGKMWLWPVDITFEGFRRVFQNDAIWIGYRNTIFYTILGTLIHLFLLIPSAYALSRREVVGRTPIMWFVIFTMFFNGGLIPNYLLIDSLKMVDTIWALILPGALGAWSILVSRTFFEGNIPPQLIESAKIDGASEFTIIWKIVIPLSFPIIAVMSLFHAVGVWNQYFNALIYISDNNLYPLQLVLRQILVLGEVNTENMTTLGTATSFADQINNASLVKYAVIIVSTLPLLIVYPFMQKYFIQGVLIGSVKE